MKSASVWCKSAFASAIIGMAAGGIAHSVSAAENPLPGTPTLGGDGNLRPDVGLPQTPGPVPTVGEGGKVRGAQDPGPRPTPPPVPSEAAVTYYSTCGNSHSPVYGKISGDDLGKYGDYYSKEYDSGSSGMKQNEEARNYYNSKEYKDYKEKEKQWEKDNRNFEASKDRDTANKPNTLGSGMISAQLQRDPKQDLALWMQGCQYHEPVNSITFGGGTPELNASLDDPITGPALTASHYARLVSMLNEDAQKQAPSPKELVLAIEVLWEGQWRRNLGFDADPTSRQLAADLERAANDTHEAKRRLEGLSKRSDASDAEKFQLMEQRAFAVKELERCQAKEQPLRETLDRRMTFIRAMVNLLRLAPDGGFGPTFAEVAEPKSVQASAAKILAQIGPLTAGPIWQGLCEDLSWLRQVKGGNEIRPGKDIHNHTMAAEAAEAALCDTRIDGLAVISEFLVSNRPAPAVVLVKAMELLDKQGTKALRAEALTALPRVIALRKHEDPEVAERAKWVLLRLLGVNGGKASMEDAIGTLAPLLKESDGQLTEAVWQFLKANTGQPLAKDAQAWLDLQKKMSAEREKAEAEKKKFGAK